MPYYLKFVEQYPTVYDLANAPEDAVLRLWQGLGYYSRARNLHACAKMVVENFNGQFPSTYPELLKLKGIGKYTAAAIASFAFDQVNAVVDGNVYRVLSRIYGVEDDIASTSGAKTFEKLANTLIDPKQPAEYNQAIMEFGAMHCSPKTPACGLCPISEECHAYNHGTQLKLPIKSKKVKVRTRHFYYFVIKEGERIYMKQRGPGDVWQGLYDFPLQESNQAISTPELMENLPPELLNNVILEEESKIFKHVLTHQRIFATFYLLNVVNHKAIKALSSTESPGPFDLKQIQDLPKPILINNFLVEHIF